MNIDDLDNAIALAAKISAKAGSVLEPLQRDMTIRAWPEELQALVWEALADAAAIRARQAREKT